MYPPKGTLFWTYISKIPFQVKRYRFARWEETFVAVPLNDPTEEYVFHTQASENILLQSYLEQFRGDPLPTDECAQTPSSPVRRTDGAESRS